jgi:oxygen-independent coproporphyrinogen-3 oxidase
MTQVAEMKTAIVEKEEIDVQKAAGEFMFLGLRMTEGVSIKKFRTRFDKAPAEMYSRVRDWIAGDLLEERRGYLRLTPKGLMLANSIFVEFM